MNEQILRLIRKAGIKYNEDYIETWERIKGRGFFARYEELENFAKLVGQKAREHERSKLEAESTAQKTKGRSQGSFDGGTD